MCVSMPSYMTDYDQPQKKIMNSWHLGQQGWTQRGCESENVSCSVMSDSL